LQDPAVFGGLLERYRPYLRAESRRHVTPGPRAPDGDSDLVQDTFAAACKQARKLLRKTDQELAAYLRTILRHRALELARARSAAEPTLADSAASALADAPDPGQPPPAEALVAKEQSELVRAAIRALPADHRAALDLRFDDGLSFGEIGRRLGRSADAARKLLARASDAIRRRVGGPEAGDR
jgi:RNA polymerase sigma-70 factor (ECF subfamily)